jgi:hypothetical protein
VTGNTNSSILALFIVNGNAVNTGTATINNGEGEVLVSGNGNSYTQAGGTTGDASTPSTTRSAATTS